MPSALGPGAYRCLTHGARHVLPCQLSRATALMDFMLYVARNSRTMPLRHSRWFTLYGCSGFSGCGVQIVVWTGVQHNQEGAGPTRIDSDDPEQAGMSEHGPDKRTGATATSCLMTK
jgi:hypothetical protein